MAAVNDNVSKGGAIPPVILAKSERVRLQPAATATRSQVPAPKWFQITCVILRVGPGRGTSVVRVCSGARVSCCPC